MTSPQVKGLVAAMKTGTRPEDYLKQPKTTATTPSRESIPVGRAPRGSEDKAGVQPFSTAQMVPSKLSEDGLKASRFEGGNGLKGTQGHSPVSSLDGGASPRESVVQSGFFPVSSSGGGNLVAKAGVWLGKQLPKAFKTPRARKAIQALTGFYQTFLKPLWTMFQPKLKWLVKWGIALVLLWIAYGVLNLVTRGCNPKPSLFAPGSPQSVVAPISTSIPGSPQSVAGPVVIPTFTPLSISPLSKGSPHSVGKAASGPTPVTVLISAPTPKEAQAGKQNGDTLKDISNAVSTVGEGVDTADKAKKLFGF